jgi:hypothetical protein
MAKQGLEERLIETVAGKKGIQLYAWFWYHTQFWLQKPARRPYTYIMRDFYYNNALLTLIITGTIFYCFGRWWLPVRASTFWAAFISLLMGLLLGHLFWGNKYVAGQQEDPTYDPDNE